MICAERNNFFSPPSLMLIDLLLSSGYSVEITVQWNLQPNQQCCKVISIKIKTESKTEKYVQK
jgi:hypothetical protein